jgi:hypothetical protein
MLLPFLLYVLPSMQAATPHLKFNFSRLKLADVQPALNLLPIKNRFLVS